jgi:anti-anti-sigma factor
MPTTVQVEAIERNFLCSAGVGSKQATPMATDPSINSPGNSTGNPSIGERALNLHTYAWEDATVVCCTGRLTTETSQLLKTEVKVLLPNKRRVILDLTDLGYMDSSGLGALVGLYISAKGARCELQLVNLSPRIRELLSLTNVLSVFESCGRYGTRMP